MPRAGGPEALAALEVLQRRGLVEQAHKQTIVGPAVQRMVMTGVLEHGLVGRLWREGQNPIDVSPRDEPMLLALLTQFDLLMPGPEPETSFVPLLLPKTLADLPARGLVAERWPETPAAGVSQAGARFLFGGGLPRGLVERLLARCAAVDACGEVQHCWREGMLARGAHGARVRVQSGVRSDPLTGQAPVAFVDVLLRAETGDMQAACRAAALPPARFAMPSVRGKSQACGLTRSARAAF